MTAGRSLRRTWTRSFRRRSAASRGTWPTYAAATPSTCAPNSTSSRRPRRTPTTPYKEWWDAPLGAEPLHVSCFKNARYEPYVVLPNLPTTPIYSEAFTGYGKNKIELITHLRFAGFRFHALPGAFVTHMPHAKSAQKLLWEAGAHRRSMDALYQKLVAQLVNRYKRPRTPSCHPGRLL